MKQMLFSVNCPYCGHVVEVICPYLDREIVVIWPRKLNTVAMKNYDFKKKYVCTKCNCEMMVYWKTK